LLDEYAATPPFLRLRLIELPRHIARRQLSLRRLYDAEDATPASSLPPRPISGASIAPRQIFITPRQSAALRPCSSEATK